MVWYTVRKEYQLCLNLSVLPGSKALPFVSDAVCVETNIYTHLSYVCHVSVLSDDQYVIRGELNLIFNFLIRWISVDGSYLPSTGRNRSCSNNEGEDTRYWLCVILCELVLLLGMSLITVEMNYISVTVSYLCGCVIWHPHRSFRSFGLIANLHSTLPVCHSQHGSLGGFTWTLCGGSQSSAAHLACSSGKQKDRLTWQSGNNRERTHWQTYTDTLTAHQRILC